MSSNVSMSEASQQGDDDAELRNDATHSHMHTHDDGATHSHVHTHDDGATHSHLHTHDDGATHSHVHTHDDSATHSHVHTHDDGATHSHLHTHDDGATHSHMHTHDDGATHSHVHTHDDDETPLPQDGDILHSLSQDDAARHSLSQEDGSGNFDGADRHAHLHEHIDATRTNTVADEDDSALGPAERYVTPADATEIVADATEIRYTGTSGLKVTVLDGLERVKRLTHLTLRSCLIADMSPIAANGATLVYLELYDNQIRTLRGVEACPHLTVLDVSFNVIRSSAPVAVCTNLQECYIAANKLRTIEGLSNLNKLCKLDLGANRIRQMGGFPRSLKQLFLGKNRIERAEGLDELAELTVLDVQSNRLTSLAGAFGPNLINLSELYLAHNAIGPDLSSEHLVNLVNLNTIDLSHNRLVELEPFAVLHKLEDFWLSYNAVPDLQAVTAVANLSLTCIYLEHNPCASDPGYVAFLRKLFPLLTQIDAIAYPARSAAA